jgi:hypothetical protein
LLGDLKTGKKKQQQRLESYRSLAGISIALVDLKKLDLTTIQMKAKDAYQHYKTLTGRQEEKARCNWMEGQINEKQCNENKDRYRQRPIKESIMKTKK